MVVTYTFHISNGFNAIRNAQNLMRALKHNLRQRTQDKDETRDIIVIDGPLTAKEAMDLAKKIVNEKTEAARNKYNAKVTHKDRLIYDVFQKLCQDGNRCIATEIIISVGDINIWQNATSEEKKLLIPFYKEQYERFCQITAAWGVMPWSAVIHPEEESAIHLHILAFCWVHDQKRGLETTISQSQVLTPERLEYLQEAMREGVIERLKELAPARFKDAQLKVKEPGRNYDIHKDLLPVFHETEKRLREREAELDEQERILGDREVNITKKEKAVKKNQDQLSNSKSMYDKAVQQLNGLCDWLNGLKKRHKRYIGKHLESVMSILDSRKIDKDTAKKLHEIGFYGYDGKDEKDVIEKAENRDIRNLLHEYGASYSAINSRPDVVKKFKKMYDDGMETDEIAIRIVRLLNDDGEWQHVIGFGD